MLAGPSEAAGVFTKSSMRLFVAMELDERVLAGAAALIDAQRQEVPHARWLTAQQLHVTLSFLGQVDQALVLDVGARLLEVARQLPPFNVRIRGAGGFPNARRPSVVWLGVEPDAPILHAMVAELQAAWKELGRSVEARAYHPHLTLARSKQPAGDARLAAVIQALAHTDLGSCAVRDIVLFQSEPSPAGVRYSALLRAPLGANLLQQR